MENQLFAGRGRDRLLSGFINRVLMLYGAIIIIGGLIEYSIVRRGYFSFTLYQIISHMAR